MGLADVEVLEGRADAAFEWLLAVVRTAPADDADAARRHLLRLMDVLSPDDPRVNDARRALSRALF
jgi:putative thioredoxin